MLLKQKMPNGVLMHDLYARRESFAGKDPARHGGP